MTRCCGKDCGEDKDDRATGSLACCCATSCGKDKQKSPLEEGTKRRRLTFSEFIWHPKTGLILNTFIITPPVLYLYQIFVATNTDPLVVLIVFCGLTLYLFAQMMYNLILTVRLPPNYALFNCIKLPSE